MSIFVNNLEQIRAAERVDFGMPEDLPTFDLLDAACLRLCTSGVLEIVDRSDIRKNMYKMKDQTLDRASFKGRAYRLLQELTVAAAIEEHDVKAVISVRAGVAFERHIEDVMPEIEVGFVTQTRDGDANPHSNYDKLGSFEGRRALAFDPMLATGGSMEHMVEAVMENGATGVTVVAAFSTPQGIWRVANLEGVDRIVSTPLEAGLDSHMYIVGGLGETRQLGDFGDRFFGNVDHLAAGAS